MRIPILMTDLMHVAQKLPNPDTFPNPEVSMIIQDSLLDPEYNNRVILFRKREFVRKNGDRQFFWTTWQDVIVR